MANLTADLLNVLRCPQTHSPLRQEGNELVSTAPGPDGKPVRYAIEEGIPVLLPASGAPADNTEN
ncbi:Trm112 family protein [Arthrobacter sp. NPDC055585]